MAENGPKDPRNPYPSDDEPTQRANLDELLSRHAAAKAASSGSADFIDDSALTDVTDIGEILASDPDAPVELPRAVRRKRVQTVMGVAPPPVAAAARAPAPELAGLPVARIAQPSEPREAPALPPPPAYAPVAVRAGELPLEAVAPEPKVQVSPSADQTAPRRGLGLSPFQPAAPPRIPLSSLLASAALSGAVAALITLLVLLLFPSARRDAESPAAEPVSTAASPAERAPEEPQTGASSGNAALDRARNGEAAAVAALEGKAASERSVEESLALAEGRAAAKRKELAELRKALSSGEPQAEAVKKLRNFAEDADVAREALGVMASLPGALAADLVYDVWVGSVGRTVVTTLAEELIQSKSLREKASPALSAALDLRLAKTCDDVGPVLERGRKDGDRRMLPLLGRLTKRKGCGLENDAACASCMGLRGADISATVFAVKGRKTPKL
jgi:hypothetical protein